MVRIVPVCPMGIGAHDSFKMRHSPLPCVRPVCMRACASPPPLRGPQHHANEFLSRFAASPEAWEVCLVLLREIDTSLAPAVIEQIAHLNACILHDKVRTDTNNMRHARVRGGE